MTAELARLHNAAFVMPRPWSEAEIADLLANPLVFVLQEPGGFLMGRVVAFRSTLVFGGMTLAMGISGVLAESVPVGLVIAGFGVLTLAGGLIGALLPAVRDA